MLWKITEWLTDNLYCIFPFFPSGIIFKSTTLTKKLLVNKEIVLLKSSRGQNEITPMELEGKKESL